MKRNIRKSLRNLKRYQEILKVFVKYGFDDVVNKVSIALLPENAKNLLLVKGKNLHRFSTPIRLRMAFEELGATFIKLGQMLSLRPDFIPAEFVLELSKLQDNVQNDELEEINDVLVKEFNKSLTDIFSEYDEIPIASASIGQVHKAKLKTGEIVAVKILHPGIERKIETDIEILEDLANLIVMHVPESRLYDPVGIVREFGKSIKKELNFINEGRNIDTFRNYMKDEPTIKTPVVYWDYTSERVLVLEYINGIKISDLQLMEESDIDRKQVAENGAKSILKQIFEFGYFHADPHPGNLFVLPGNILAPIDFGNVGRIDEEMQDGLLDILKGAVVRDSYRIARTLIHIGIIEDTINLRDLQRDLMEFIDNFYGMPLNQLNLTKLINEFITLIRLHKIKLPPDIVIMGRTLAIYEVVGRNLYPQFNMFELLIPFTEKAFFNRINPLNRYRSIIRTAENSIDLLKNLPDYLQNILHKISNNKLKITFHHDRLEELAQGIDRASNRLSFSIIIAALIIGSSIIIQLDRGPILWGYPVFGTVGFIIASFLGIWLLIGIIRSGKL